MTIPAGRPVPGTYWYHADGLGSIRNLTDATQAVVNTYDYEAFGQSFAPGIFETIANDYTFTARRMGAESEWMYYRNRQYGPFVGRFVSRDPQGYAGAEKLLAQGTPIMMNQRYTYFVGLQSSPGQVTYHYLSGDGAMFLSGPLSVNLYVYASNRPTGLFDPTGERDTYTRIDSRKKWRGIPLGRWNCGKCVPVGPLAMYQPNPEYFARCTKRFFFIKSKKRVKMMCECWCICREVKGKQKWIPRCDRKTATCYWVNMPSGLARGLGAAGWLRLVP